MNDPCQNELLPSGSSHVPRTAVLAGQVRYYLKQRGFVSTLRRIFSFLASKAMTLVGLGKKISRTQPKAPRDELLSLQPGELVEVKSENEIRRTLDQNAQNRGLAFTPEMRKYCGQRLRVFKRVERICMEGIPGEMRQLRNTVILEGAICDGGSRSCDRSCFFFWREVWLRRVTDN
jgi:hypothetical protein